MATELVESPSIQVMSRFIEANKDRIAEAMPEGVRTELVTRSLVSMMRQDTSIAACTPASLRQCLESMVLTGLDVAKGLLGKAYIVPYGREATFQIGYKGIKEMVRRSGQGGIVMGDVREGDRFEPQNKFTLPIHEESTAKDRHTKPLTHVFAAYIPNVGRPVVEVWSIERCISHRDQYSKGYKGAKNKKDHPWHIANPGFPVMAMKCPVMYLAGRGDLPLSPDQNQVIAAAMEGEAIEAQSVRVVEQTQPAIEQQDDDTPPEMDWTWFDEKLNKVGTELALDKFRDEMVGEFPHAKQEIWDKCEEFREMIKDAKKKEPAPDK